jgi:Winged helix domain, variant/ATPase family associated with various cellular activities (AAA)
VVAATSQTRPEVISFATHLDHLEAELRLLDLIVLHDVVAMRREAAAASESHGLYVSHEEVHRLLDPDPPGDSGDAGALAAIQAAAAGLRAAIDAAVARGHGEGLTLPLPQLAARLGLTALETQVIIVCVAPELDRKYDRLYAYLQNDITRKRPSVDLVTRLLCSAPHDRWRALASFSAHSPLLRHGILRTVDDPHSPSGSSALAQFLQVDPRILSHLLGDFRLDPRLDGIARLVDAAAEPVADRRNGSVEDGLLSLVQHHSSSSDGPLVIYLRGPYGAGHETVTKAVAARLGRPLVCLDTAVAPRDGHDLGVVLEAAFRDGWLLGAPVLVLGAERLLPTHDEHGLGGHLAATVGRYPGITFLAGTRPWPRPGRLPGVTVHETCLTVPGVADRQIVWSAVLPPDGVAWAPELAGRFRLTPGQIRDAAAEVARFRTVRNDHATPSLADWFSACRNQSNQKLAELAQKLSPSHGWADLVLDPPRLEQLREMCAQVRHRERVFSEWGFGRKLTLGRGITALFAGPPGTGKTLAACVVANDLQLDLYRVDLSQVVSKYIGETEKNLARIFSEAETSNAVLLFDEADALFGKRTEIRDAHDRYANIETSYLLQRMEEYEGIAILATNLRQNMDEAFLRRLRLIVEFPFPDAASRLRIWSGHLAEAPVADDLDLELLADHLPGSGGSIRNIVLVAAFLAAASNEPIGMAQLVRAAKREFEKSGKLWVDLPVDTTDTKET